MNDKAHEPGTVSTSDFAKLIGRSTRRVEQLAKQTIGSGGEERPILLRASGRGRLRLAESFQGYCLYLYDQIETAEGAKARQEEFKAQQLEMDVLERRGELIPIEDVFQDVSTLLMSVKARMLAAATDLATSISNDMTRAEKVATATELIEDALRAIAETDCAFVRQPSWRPGADGKTAGAGDAGGKADGQ